LSAKPFEQESQEIRNGIELPIKTYISVAELDAETHIGIIDTIHQLG
jgi:hypothetical protein